MHVSKITIGRLFNLGNYEHVRYEIAVDVCEGESARAVLKSLEDAIEGLNPKPPHGEYEMERARKTLAKTATALDQFDLANLEAYRNFVKEYDEWASKRQDARVALDKLGEVSEKHTDAKLDWQED